MKKKLFKVTASFTTDVLAENQDTALTLARNANIIDWDFGHIISVDVVEPTPIQPPLSTMGKNAWTIGDILAYASTRQQCSLSYPDAVAILDKVEEMPVIEEGKLDEIMVNLICQYIDYTSDKKVLPSNPFLNDQTSKSNAPITETPKA